MLQPLNTSPELPGPHPHPPTAHSQTPNTHLKIPVFITTPRISQKTGPQLSPISLRVSRPLKNIPLLALPRKQCSRRPFTPQTPQTLSQTTPFKSPRRSPPISLTAPLSLLSHQPPPKLAPISSLADLPPQSPHSAAPLLNLAELLALAERLEGEALVALGAGVQRRHPAAPPTGAAVPPARPAAPPPPAVHWPRAVSFTPPPLSIGACAVTHSYGTGRAGETVTSRGRGDAASRPRVTRRAGEVARDRAWRRGRGLWRRGGACPGVGNRGGAPGTDRTGLRRTGVRNLGRTGPDRTGELGLHWARLEWGTWAGPGQTGPDRAGEPGPDWTRLHQTGLDYGTWARLDGIELDQTGLGNLGRTGSGSYGWTGLN